MRRDSLVRSLTDLRLFRLLSGLKKGVPKQPTKLVLKMKDRCVDPASLEGVLHRSYCRNEVSTRRKHLCGHIQATLPLVAQPALGCSLFALRRASPLQSPRAVAWT